MNWEVTDHILARNRRAALNTLKDLLDDQVEPVMLIGLIGGTYRRMALAKELLSQGAPPGQIFREVRMPSFKQSAYLSLLGRLESNTMSRALQLIAQSAPAIKS